MKKGPNNITNNRNLLLAKIKQMPRRYEGLEVLVDEHGLLHVAVQLSSLVAPTRKFPRMQISFVPRDIR